ncbi:MAG: aminotransferase class V-fold PLP-dependent enzyme [Planctomycetota bacterium]|jgi:cysteine desulfurase family protein
MKGAAKKAKKKRGPATEGIYVDNPATSWPKPEEVYRAVDDFMRRCGGTPARGKHPRTAEADRIQQECRAALHGLLGGDDGYHLTLTSGATESLNLAIKGILRPGAHVVVTELEHNSVLRPISRLIRDMGVKWTVVEANEDGTVDPSRVRDAILPETWLVAVTHASNVLGTWVNVDPIVEVAHESGVPVLVDAAQTTGVVDISVASSGIDLLAFTGHKSLLGPPGTGGLIFRKDLDMLPLKEGGTGTQSDVPEHPEELPARYETGSPNMYGYAGLLAGVKFLKKKRVKTVRKHKQELIAALREDLLRIPGVKVYGTEHPEKNVGILSFNVGDMPATDAASLLWERGKIMLRAGIHCAPLLHPRIGTKDQGTVRAGVGWASKPADVKALARTVREIAKG